MTIIKKDIFEDIFGVYQKLNQIFDDRLARFKKELKAGEEHSSWMPPVDIYEDDASFIIAAELPGFDKKEIDIKIKDNTIILQGNRKLRNPEEHGFNYHRIEMNFGAFSRAFNVPEKIDEDKVSAVYIDGVLEIRLLKIKAPPAAKIKIK
ncbi:MAG: hypothetical protein A2Y62_19010 [Candidatus Fischerbacteria bacterium RBG_13_37_8]|uniref:SHSP domain-containing protein n=1 Tax=Candidatus Fischerbacteria bacterium RBG_13_37_8 TaxID=1817863 RepID=A0A1F5VKA9_9BACT|nr:MAG: hypothetical protein A2Y62_19010 [Candidatus Fischerbacteria bacterium RBG_13_37_8]